MLSSSIISLTLKGKVVANLDDKAFQLLQLENKQLKFERLSDRSITIGPFDGLDVIETRSSIHHQLLNWIRLSGVQSVCLVNCPHLFKNGSILVPDIAISDSVITGKSGLLEAMPTFVIEIKQPYQEIKPMKARMREWIRNGVRLVWLIDLKKEVVHILDGRHSTMHFGFERKVCASPQFAGLEISLPVRKRGGVRNY